MTKVAINGFGRIGRLAFRQMFTIPLRVVSAARSVRTSTLLRLVRISSLLMARRLLSMLFLTLLNCLGVSWTLTSFWSALVSIHLRRRLLPT